MALGLRRGPPKQASPLAYLALRPGKRSASTLAQFNHERWTRDPQVVRLVSEIRSHYFPRPPRRDRRTSDEEQGLPLSKALEGLLQLARQDATLTPETAMVIQAKCRLAGEKYDHRVVNSPCPPLPNIVPMVFAVCSPCPTL